MLTPASQFNLGGAAGFHIFPVRKLRFLLRITYMVHGDKVVVEEISKAPIVMQKISDSNPPWI